MRILNNLIYFILLALVFSCTKMPVETLSKRTLILYLAGDNNLSWEIDMKTAAFAQALFDMEKNGIAVSDYKVVAFADYSDQMPRIIEITSKGRNTIEVFPALNSASAGSLSEILGRIKTLYPAESYGLICFSHASGWFPQGALTDPVGYKHATKTIFVDGETEMPIDEFAEAISCEDKFDFIIFEACHMASFEALFELRDKTQKVMVSAAEILSPGFQECYPGGLQYLLEETPDIESFADLCYKYWNQQTGPLQSVTLSVIDTKYVEELAMEYWQLIYSSKEIISSPENIQAFNRSPYKLIFDLSSYLKKVTGEKGMDKFYDILHKAVTYEAHSDCFMKGYTGWFEINEHCGVTVYIMQPDYPDLNADYMQTSFYKYGKRMQ